MSFSLQCVLSCLLYNSYCDHMIIMILSNHNFQVLFSPQGRNYTDNSIVCIWQSGEICWFISFPHSNLMISMLADIIVLKRKLLKNKQFLTLTKACLSHFFLCPPWNNSLTGFKLFTDYLGIYKTWIFRICKTIQGTDFWLTLGLILEKYIKRIKPYIFNEWKPLRYILLMYVYWYSVPHSILSNKLGTLNPFTFNHAALLCFLCFLLSFASRTPPEQGSFPLGTACLAPSHCSGTTWSSWGGSRALRQDC